MLWELKTWVFADSKEDAIEKLKEHLANRDRETEGEKPINARRIPDDSLIPDHYINHPEK